MESQTGLSLAKPLAAIFNNSFREGFTLVDFKPAKFKKWIHQFRNIFKEEGNILLTDVVGDGYGLVVKQMAYNCLIHPIHTHWLNTVRGRNREISSSVTKMLIKCKLTEIKPITCKDIYWEIISIVRCCNHHPFYVMKTNKTVRYKTNHGNHRCCNDSWDPQLIQRPHLQANHYQKIIIPENKTTAWAHITFKARGMITVTFVSRTPFHLPGWITVNPVCDWQVGGEDCFAATSGSRVSFLILDIHMRQRGWAMGGMDGTWDLWKLVFYWHSWDVW